jgi:selenide,water dikinase
VLKSVVFPENENIIVDASKADDAGIYRLNDETALVHTTDFFTPIVDDPYLFGKIAATNALSDIYAMGGTPLSALNIICFPDHSLDAEAFQAILQGGADKIDEAGAVILGGHSVSDKELKYGLAVVGIIRPDLIKVNRNLEIGDQILLTKPIGTGILTTALKNDALDENQIVDAIESMLLLNQQPARAMQKFNATACTDVTGYGLLGHLWEMMDGLNLGVKIQVDKIEFFKKAIPLARESRHIPGGTLANISYIQSHLDMGDIEPWYQNLLFDPQTSGGLLIALSEPSIEAFRDSLSDYPFDVTAIGEVVEGENKIYLY